MQKYPNLQKSVYFQILPLEAQAKILAQTDIGKACREVQLQLEIACDSEQWETIGPELQRRLKAGEKIDAMAEIGLKGHNPFEVKDDQLRQLIEIDPVGFHPASTWLTPKAEARWDAIFKEHLGENYKEEMG
ncbi:hypothetical protein GALL_213110 [mine drainage metagenome]|uniref:Uncharacterized protein n=1 Tax=mine drainage metagenome TaxID=410659 RepID=A0A1J5S4N7_9ZZZZ